MTIFSKIQTQLNGFGASAGLSFNFVLKQNQ